MKRLLPRLLGLCLVAGVLGAYWPAPAQAEPPAHGSKKRSKKKRGKQARAAEHESEPAKPNTAAHPERAEHAERAERTPGSGRSAAAEAARAAAQESAAGADSQIVKEGDTSVKVMSFTGLDIEGRLKSPQLLYFVNRVHAEFERPKLPHRSFMPELERSTQQDPFP